MDVRQCRRCGRLFNYVGNYNCPECVHEIDDIFIKVRDALYDNPRYSITELCELTGAEPAYITAWLREGRLIMRNEASKMLTCQSCGTPIHMGRYCERCSDNVAKTLTDTAAALGSKQKSKDYMTDVKGLHVDMNRKDKPR